MQKALLLAFANWTNGTIEVRNSVILTHDKVLTSEQGLRQLGKRNSQTYSKLQRVLGRREVIGNVAPEDWGGAY